MADRYSEEHSVDSRKGGYVVDFRPTTLLEQSLNGGYDRTSKPVGAASQEGPEIQTTGGARMGDALDAIRIGANGRKKK